MEIEVVAGLEHDIPKKKEKKREREREKEKREGETERADRLCKVFKT